MMKLNLSDNKVIGFLLIALILQILLLLWHLGLLGSWGQIPGDEQGVLAGTIEKVENKIKRRPLDQLIWEESRSKADLYFHDSLLTLSESTAKISLKNGTQINLSENTLITIEPEDNSGTGEIRLRMAQGSFNARNPYKKAKIQAGETLVAVEANSDIDIIKDQDGKMEIAVNQGQAQVQYGDEVLALQKQDRVLLEENQVTREKLSNQLFWNDTNLLRLYTHSPTASLSFDWQGLAETLVIQQSFKEIRRLSLQEQQDEIEVRLPLGHYQVFLIGKEGRTKTKEVQIWQAPKVSPLSPRPRDRIKTGPVAFVWTPHPQAVSYELHLYKGPILKKVTSLTNKLTTEITEEGDWFWQVWGVDQKGFKIPPSYRDPVFLRHNPFAPPKLKKPQLIRSRRQDTNAFWQHLFIPQAWAQSSEQALFQWEPVAGAEVYFIEIATDQEFRTPVVQERLSEPQYLWSGFDVKKNYHWRVAAGDRSGRMGIFTDPTPVEWERVLPKKPEPMEKKPKTTSPPAKPLPETVQTEKAPFKTKSHSTPRLPPQPITPDVARKSQQAQNHQGKRSLLSWDRGLFLASPSYALKNFKLDGSTKANLVGPSLQSAAIELQWKTRDDGKIRWYSKFNQVEYEPKPKEQFPFQPNVQSRQWVNHVIWNPASSAWGGGLWMAELPSLQRASFEEVALQQQWAYGIAGSRLFQSKALTLQSLLALLAQRDQYGVTTSQRLLFQLPWLQIQTGLELEAIYRTGNDREDWLVDIYWLFGWQF